MTRSRKGVPRELFVTLGVMALIGFMGVLWWGRAYYPLPLEERPLQELHSHLRSSGTLGLTLGIGGTVLMLLNLTYLGRKHIRVFRGLGSLRTWMRFHVLTGLVGPGAIVLHTAFSPTSSLGSLGLTAMLVVVVAGVVGRYIYAHVPRSRQGHELQLHEIEQRLARYETALERLGIRLPTVTASTPASEAPKGIPASLLSVVAGDREVRRQYRNLRRQILGVALLVPHRATILPVLQHYCRERQWLIRFEELQRLMNSWRFLHRWLAVLTLLVVALHIVLAFVYGDLWIVDVA